MEEKREKRKTNRTRLWIDEIKVTDNGLYQWSVYQGGVLKKSGIAFSPEEAQTEINEAREKLGI